MLDKKYYQGIFEALEKLCINAEKIDGHIFIPL